MADNEAFLRVRTTSLQCIGSPIGGVTWFICPVCQHAVRVDRRESNAGIAHFDSGCRVRFDLTSDGCWIPMKDVPHAFARRLIGSQSGGESV